MKTSDKIYLKSIDKKKRIEGEMYEISQREGTEFELSSDDVRYSVLKEDLQKVNKVLKK